MLDSLRNYANEIDIGGKITGFVSGCADLATDATSSLRQSVKDFVGKGKPVLAVAGHGFNGAGGYIAGKEEAGKHVPTGNSHHDSDIDSFAVLGGVTGSVAGGAAGSAAGAAAGAAIGSIFPIVGTGIGAAVGGFIGGYAGSSYGGEYGAKAGISFIDNTYKKIDDMTNDIKNGMTSEKIIEKYDLID